MDPDRFARQRAEADRLRAERIARMSPLERMEEAYRLFRLGRAGA